MKRKYHQLNRDVRIKFETLLNAGHTKIEIAAALNIHLSTVYRELKRGKCERRDYLWRPMCGYSADIAQQNRDFLATSKGAPLKIGCNYRLSEFIEKKILEDKYSPAAVSQVLRKRNLPYLSEGTIYRYVKQGVFLNLRPEHLPEHGVRKHPYRHVVHKNKAVCGTSIEKRPLSVFERSDFGHWEFDSVVGRLRGRGESVLVLTERLTRFEIILKASNKDSASTVALLDSLRRISSPGMFKSITCDNGSEFANSSRMEFSAGGRRWTHVYYCHPYTSCERGSNENANRMVRRWFPKGRSLRRVTSSQCRSVSVWMNTYPRQVLGWKTASEAFVECCNRENIKISPAFSQYLS